MRDDFWESAGASAALTGAAEPAPDRGAEKALAGYYSVFLEFFEKHTESGEHRQEKGEKTIQKKEK